MYHVILITPGYNMYMHVQNACSTCLVSPHTRHQRRQRIYVAPPNDRRGLGPLRGEARARRHKALGRSRPSADRLLQPLELAKTTADFPLSAERTSPQAHLQRLVATPTFARRGAGGPPRHSPRGPPRCGLARLSRMGAAGHPGGRAWARPRPRPRPGTPFRRPRCGRAG